MKRFVIFFLTTVFFFSLVACGQVDTFQNNNQSGTSESVVQDVSAASESSNADVEKTGSYGWKETCKGFSSEWELSSSPVVTDEYADLFSEAFRNSALTGGGYHPVAYLGSFDSNVTYHCFLCKETAAIQNPKPAKYTLIVISVDQDNYASMDNRWHSDCSEVSGFDYSDEWAETEDPTATDSARASLEKASSEFGGMKYEPLALLALREYVNNVGNEYLMLCRITVDTTEDEPLYAMVCFYDYNEGSAKIEDVYYFSSGRADY